MRILYIIDPLNTGGKEHRLVELIKGLEYEKEISKRVVLLEDYNGLNKQNHYIIERSFEI